MFFSAPHNPPRTVRASQRPRCLALGLCLTASLALSACGPAHKGQLTVEPVSASAEASSSTAASKKPSSSISPSVTRSPSAPATWSRPSVTFANEDTSIWSRNDELANTSKNSNDVHTEGFEFNNGQGCQGYISQYVSEDYFKTHPIDNLDSMTAATTKSNDFTTFQTTSTSYTSRIVGKEGYALYVGLVCPPESPASLEQWHTILAGIRVQGIDAGAM